MQYEIVRIRQPYAGSPGIQFVLSAPEFETPIHVTWRGTPIPPEELHEVPFRRLPWFIFRAEEFFAHMPADNLFPAPCRTLLDCVAFVEQHLAVHGAPVDVEPPPDGVKTLDTILA